MRRPLRCLTCGYDLTGICTPERREGECPECGAAFHRRGLELARKRAGSVGRLVVELLIAAGGTAVVMVMAPMVGVALVALLVGEFRDPRVVIGAVAGLLVALGWGVTSGLAVAASLHRALPFVAPGSWLVRCARWQLNGLCIAAVFLFILALFMVPFILSAWVA